MGRRLHLVVMTVIIACAVAAGAFTGAAAAGGARAGAVAGSWGRAIEVPGLGALNARAKASYVIGVFSVSCASPGGCAAGGGYRDRQYHNQGFVAAERHGRWEKAIEVPGLGALNAGGYAEVTSVSCASPGSCAAGGNYRDRQYHDQGFVAAERHGRWGKAIEVPGLGVLNTGGNAYVSEVSCASPGSCAAGGGYGDRQYHDQGFVAAERHGRWEKAIEVPGLGVLNTGGNAEVTSVSCASPGNCAAAGVYTDRHRHGQGFVASERHGRWGQAIEVPGLGALNTGGNAEVTSVSCASPGSCAAGGVYTVYLDSSYNQQGFVVSEQDGVWGRAIGVPGLGALNTGGDAQVSSVSCAPAGGCAAGGYYWDSDEIGHGFVAGEQDGVWGQAIEVPGLGALGTGGYAGVTSVSCASPGNCAAGGDYADGGHNGQGFVASEQDGVWGQAIEVPGLGGLNRGGDAQLRSVSCAPAGGCAAGGNYADRRHHFQGFVVSQTG